MSTTQLKKSRAAANQRQGSRCCYCGLPIWLEAPEVFAARHRISMRQARHLQCTAEHVVARKDGGRDARANILAACRFCNQARHRRKKDLSSGLFMKWVGRRVAAGRWHNATFPTLI